MKKLLYILLPFAVFMPSIVYSSCSNSCKIEDSPAPALSEYFTNIEKITDNILDALGEAEPIEGRSLKQERNRVIAGLNSLLSFGDYFGSFDYYISLPITQEVPGEVKRDHDKIEQLTEKLTNILETAEKRATAGTRVIDVCNGVSNCSLASDLPARGVLVEIIKNNQKIAQIYRASVTEKPATTKDRDVILVSSDFVSQIESYYNKDTLTACSECEGGFLDTIREKIQNISFKNSDYKQGVEKWKDAWAMLRGGSSNPGYQRREAELISEHLKNSGIDSEKSDIITGNLERYNAGGLSTSNPLFNTAYTTQANVEEEIKTFNETLLEKFSSGEERIPVVELVRVDTQLKGSSDISKSIATLYEEQLPFSLVQDTIAQDVQARIIRMHIDLVQSIEGLGKQVKSTEKICDKQGQGLGKCSFR